MSIISSFLNNIDYLMPFKKKIGYLGWIGFGNLGDEALFEANKRIFREQKVLPYKHTHKIEIYEKTFKRSIYDAVCLGGGTLINSSHINKFKEAQDIGYPTFVFGSGVRNPIFWNHVEGWEDSIGEWISLLNKCRFIGVRGPLSEEILRRNGCQNVEIIGDPVLHLAESNVKYKEKNKKICINIGISLGNIWGSEDEVLEFIIKLAKILLSSGWDVSFLPVWNEDLKYIEEAVKKIGIGADEIFKDYLSTTKTLEYLKSFDILIGEKLHSVILAMCVYTPSIMLEYRPKCLDFMKSMDLEKFNVRTDMLSIDLIMDLINELYVHPDAIQDHIFKKISQYKNIQKEKSRMIFEDKSYF